MMALIVEDGSIVTDANSYNTEAEIIAYAAIFGKEITTEQAEQYVLMNRGYLDTLLYQGEQVSFGVQSLPFPRKYVYIEGNLLDYTAIPSLLKKAEQELALMRANGLDPQESVTPANYVKEESFAVFKKVYMDNRPDSNTYPKLNAYLFPLLASDGGGLHFRLDRSYG